jgi:zinc D-Ala-D-Ala carboxypeptidase
MASVFDVLEYSNLYKNKKQNREMRFTKNFTLEELLESDIARRMNYTEQFDPPPHIIANLLALSEMVLQPLRDKLGVPITVTSGYRCERLNKRVKGARTSEHLSGQAADIKIHGYNSKEITNAIIELDLPFNQVIEEFGIWVHVSHNSTPFNKKQALRAVKANGRTHYLNFNN